jgi:acyl-CoA synthetase (AMP-forming)/AMP-acid ligase II
MNGGGPTGGGKNTMSSSSGRNENASSTFVRTGDQGRIHENGEITLLGRIKSDMKTLSKRWIVRSRLQSTTA